MCKRAYKIYHIVPTLSGVNRSDFFEMIGKFLLKLSDRFETLCKGRFYWPILSTNLTSNLIIGSWNRTARVRHQCRKTTVLGCCRCLISTSFWKNGQHLNIDSNFDHLVSLCKSKCWYSNNCLHFLKRAGILAKSMGSKMFFFYMRVMCCSIWLSVQKQLPKIQIYFQIQTKTSW